MFYNSVGTIRKNIQKSRTIIFVMGLGAPKMPKMPIWPVFEGQGELSGGVGGVCERQNILYLEFA